MTCPLSLKACPLRSLALHTLSLNLGFKWDKLTDEMLKTIAQFWLVLAITSQLMLGYFAANYYENTRETINQNTVTDSLIRTHAIQADIIKFIYQ